MHLSDLLEGAPESVLRAIAHILLAKLYRKPLNAVQTTRYRRFASSEAVIRQTELIRQSRGRKKMLGPQGQHYDLDEVFESLNRRFFHGLMGRPLLTWSGHMAKRSLGHYDPAHNTIVVSRVFDRKNTPRLRGGVPALPRDVALEASGKSPRRPPLCASPRIPDGRAPLPRVAPSQGIPEDDLIKALDCRPSTTLRPGRDDHLLGFRFANCATICHPERSDLQ